MVKIYEENCRAHKLLVSPQSVRFRLFRFFKDGKSVVYYVTCKQTPSHSITMKMHKQYKSGDFFQLVLFYYGAYISNALTII